MTTTTTTAKQTCLVEAYAFDINVEARKAITESGLVPQGFYPVNIQSKLLRKGDAEGSGYGESLYSASFELRAFRADEYVETGETVLTYERIPEEWGHHCNGGDYHIEQGYYVYRRADGAEIHLPFHSSSCDLQYTDSYGVGYTSRNGITHSRVIQARQLDGRLPEVIEAGYESDPDIIEYVSAGKFAPKN